MLLPILVQSACLPRRCRGCHSPGTRAKHGLRSWAGLGASALADRLHQHRGASGHLCFRGRGEPGSYPRAHDLELFGVALVCIVATVELTRRAGENAGFVKDVHAVWELPVAMLLPLAYAPLAPIVRFALIQWRVRRVALLPAGVQRGRHRAELRCRRTRLPRAHPAGAWPGLQSGGPCPGLDGDRRRAPRRPVDRQPGPGPDRDQGLRSRAVSLREIQFAREPMYNDVTELCLAVLVTFCVAISLHRVRLRLSASSPCCSGRCGTPSC